MPVSSRKRPGPWVWVLAGVVQVLALVVAFLGGAVWRQSPPPASTPNQLAEQFDVTIHWYERGDPDPCGDHSGCFLPSSPDVIYVQSQTDDERRRSVILHELAHVIQYRLGQPLDECAADALSRLMGGQGAGYDC